jgi:hypothetical protein
MARADRRRMPHRARAFLTNDASAKEPPMDSLHTMLRSLKGERTSQPSRRPPRARAA